MKQINLLSIVLIAAMSCFIQAKDWQPAHEPLMTSWAGGVSPTKVWPEYPRPQMVRKDWKNLNGLWDYAITPKDAQCPQQWDGKILVPFCVESALSGVKKKVLPDQCLWYHTILNVPKVKSTQRLLLHFGAVDWQSTVWINGSEVGRHVGGYDPFDYDITDFLKAGTNELVVKVWDPTDKGSQPHGKQVLDPGGIMYTAVTGIWQTVWLETVPAIYIKSLKIVPDTDREILQVTVNASGDAMVEIKALDGGKVVSQGKGRTEQTIELKVQNIKLWTPDFPNLYDLKVSLVGADRTIDSVDSYFGMRKIEVKKDNEGVNRLFLNNKAVFQYGPLDQGWWPEGLYTPATEEALKYDIVMTKKFGMNMARKHVKYESARWYYWCDKLGLLVWQDMPSGDSGRDQDSKVNFRRELKAMIDTLHNFPCIVMWIPFNEGWGQHDTVQIVKWIEEYDPTRPVNEVSGWHNKDSGSVSDRHCYPGPGMNPMEENRVCVLGEFGGLGMPVKGHLWQEDRNWGYVSYKDETELTNAYVDLMRNVRPLIGMGLSAAVYTQTTDVEIEVNGLMTYDRKKVKMDLNRCAEAAGKFYLLPPKVRVLLPTSQKQKQQWRYTTDEPVADWYRTAFDDSSWESGPGGFGTAQTPGAIVGTKWNSSDIWLRRTFELDKVPAGDSLSLMIHHDEDAEVYLNGKLIKKFPRFIGEYTLMTLSPDAINALKTGTNTIAVHCRQTQGGQFIDMGLSLLIEPDVR